MHLIYYLGLFRVLPLKDFQCEVAVGYCLDLVISILPMFLLQVMNNYDTENSLTTIQSLTIMIKMLCFLLLIIEMLIFVWEVM